MNIVLIGTGNTAAVLGKKLKAAGHNMVQVFGRNAAAAASLAYPLGAVPTADPAALYPAADLYLLAVSDGAIEAVAQELLFPDNSIVAHTAASVPLEVLKGKAARYGVFYPLQSLKKELAQLPEVPILIDASDETTLHHLDVLAHTISDKVYVAGDAMRVKMHLAAVMVNNFTNHLYALVENYCRQEGLDFQLLQPLILETAMRLSEISPVMAQTGPAVRNDGATIEKHLELLQKYPQLKSLYQSFTESIRPSR